MKKLALAVALVVPFSFTGCSLFSEGGSGSAAASAGNAEVEALIKQAEDAINKAASVDGEWRDAKDKYLKEAKAALSKGDVKAAMKFAETAKFEGEMGYNQAVAQKNAGPWLF
jgi:hypothetical protein